jgi:hypothetical protein
MGGWSMKKDRELIQLARTRSSVDSIAAKLEKPPKSVLKAARRLGLNIEAPAKRDGRLKAGK